MAIDWKTKDEQDLKKARTTRKDTEWSIYKQLKNRCNNMINNAKQKYRNKLIAKNSKNPKTFWKAVKEVSPTENITSSSFTPSSIPEKISKAHNFQFIFFICPWKHRHIHWKSLYGVSQLNQQKKSIQFLAATMSANF